MASQCLAEKWTAKEVHATLHARFSSCFNLSRNSLYSLDSSSFSWHVAASWEKTRANTCREHAKETSKWTRYCERVKENRRFQKRSLFRFIFLVLCERLKYYACKNRYVNFLMLSDNDVAIKRNVKQANRGKSTRFVQTSRWIVVSDICWKLRDKCSADNMFLCVVWESDIVWQSSTYLSGRSTAVKLMAMEIRRLEVIRYRQRMFGGYSPGYPGLARTHPSWQSVSSYTESHSANKKTSRRHTMVIRSFYSSLS